MLGGMVKMKIRNSFVSNSSSCSFIIAGFEIEELTSIELLKKIYDKTEENITSYMLSKGCEVQKVNDIKERNFYCEDWIFECRENEKDWDFIMGSDDGVPEGKIVVGKFLAETNADDSDLPDDNFDLEELTQEMNILKERINEPNAKLKIFIGSRCC